MATPNSWLSMIRPVQGFEIQGSDAARSSDWVGLQNYQGVVFVLQAEDGAAADDITVTLRQARTATGTGAKALQPRAWYRMQGADLAAVSAPSRQTGASIVIEGDAENLLYVEVDAAELDVEGGFGYVQLQTNNGGAASKIIGCTAYACGPRYAVAPEEMVNPLA